MSLKSKNLKIKLTNFKTKFALNYVPIKFEQNEFDKLIENILVIIKYLYNQTVKIFFKKKYMNILAKIISSLTNQKYSKINNKIEMQQKIIDESLILNKNLIEQIGNLNLKLNKLIDDNKFNNFEDTKKSNNNNEIIKSDLTKEKFYQDENLRLSNELHEVKKKFDIMKNENHKYVTQRSSLIQKLNNLNNEIENSNVLTNVFENDYFKKSEKIEIHDHNKKTNNKIKNIDLDFEIKNIFNKNIS